MFILARPVSVLGNVTETKAGRRPHIFSRIEQTKQRCNGQRLCDFIVDANGRMDQTELIERTRTTQCPAIVETEGRRARAINVPTEKLEPMGHPVNRGHRDVLPILEIIAGTV